MEGNLSGELHQLADVNLNMYMANLIVSSLTTAATDNPKYRERNYFEWFGLERTLMII